MPPKLHHLPSNLSSSVTNICFLTIIITIDLIFYTNFWFSNKLKKLGVAGGTASGKTTVCNLINSQFHDQRVVLINQVIKMHSDIIFFCFIFYQQRVVQLIEDPLHFVSPFFLSLSICTHKSLRLNHIANVRILSLYFLRYT